MISFITNCKQNWLSFLQKKTHI